MTARDFAKRYGLLIVLVVLVAVAFASGITKHITLSELKAQRLELVAFVDAHWLAAVSIFALLYTTVVALSLPLALVLTLTGGFLFGPVVGALLSASSATLGSTIAFLACRTAFGETVAERAGPRLTKLVDGFRRDAFSYLFTLRILPIAPLLLINIAAGLARVRLATFVSASLIGMAPGSFVYAFLGSGLGEVFERGDEPNLHIITEPRILLPLIGLAILAMLPAVVRLVRKRVP
ncbi:MAG TPA: TVP38/TMEM64 family protein [Caulobacteraceae bacterium]